MLTDWIDAGQPASTFDDQTPRTHAAIMEGCKRREMRAVQQDVALAWRIENFSRSGKKLKDLDHYLGQLKPKREQTADDVANIFLSLKAKGRSVKIKVRERKEDGG